MIVIYWKWEVGKWLSKLLKKCQIWHFLMDDQDFDEQKLKNAEQIVASPWIKPTHKIYNLWGNKVVSELTFLWKLVNQNNVIQKLFQNIITIGITWTNWKSTTTWIIYQILKNSLSLKYEVLIWWNFKPSVSNLLSDIIDWKYNSDKKLILVLEVSSFMLWNLSDWFFDFGVITNIAVDHLDWHLNLQDYQNSKKNILTHSKIWNVNWEDYLQNHKLPKISNKYFIGQHNQKNLSLALEVSKQVLNYLQTKEKTENDLNNNLLEIIKKIKPLPHRLQYFDTIDWIEVYDDCICTSSHAQQQALQSFDQKIVLICGWADKWDDFEHLSELYRQKVWFGVCLWNQMATKFSQIFDKLDIPNIQVLTMNDAIKQSLQNAKKYWLTKVLISPWCASFDIFKNVYDRCLQFEQIVKKMKNLPKENQ